jgi:predicted permease
VPFWFDFRVDHRLLFFIVLLTLATGVIAGLLPALKASRVDVNESLKDDSRGTSSIRMGRFFKWLVCGQVTLSAALLIVAGAQAQLVVKLRQVNMPFDPDQLMMGRLEIQDAVYDTPEARVQFYDRLLNRVRAIPGVADVAVSSRNLVYGGANARFEIDRKVYENDNEKPMAQLEVISEDYFETIGVSILSGRAFDSRDRIGSPSVALVNEKFANKYWPNESPLGKRIRHNEKGAEWATIVGVAPDLSMQGLVTGPGQASEGIYLCEAQKAWGWLNLMVRADGDANALIGDLRSAVAAIDPQQPIHSFGTLSEQTKRQMQGFEVIGTQELVFGIVTVFLGAVGIYGVTAFSVGQRSREFGVRMALGATAGSILKLVFRQGSIQVIVGLILGTVLAILLTLPTQIVVPQVQVNYTTVMMVVLGLVALVAAVAMWVPARRASRVNPLDVLRHD